MWELFQKILKNKITPDACLALFYLKEGITPSNIIDSKACFDELVKAGFLIKNEKKYKITKQGFQLISRLNSYFIKAKY